jgi:hypothetical protein
MLRTARHTGGVMTAYILIDFENVQPDKMGHLGDGAFRFKVLVGAKQTRVPYEMTQALQPLGTAVEWVKIAGSGRNALDLHIAYMIGRLSVEEPGSVFHIVSKDTDYDPLIAYLKQNKIVCHRWAAVTDIPHPRHVAAKPAPAAKPRAKPVAKAPVKAAAAAAPTDRVAEIADNLARRTRGLPATVKALASTVKAHFRGVGVTDSDVSAILSELEKRGLVAVKDGKVSYPMAKR